MPVLDAVLEKNVEVEIEGEVEFEVYCAVCNAGLCNQSEVTRTRGRCAQCVRVTPCEKCLENAADAGYKKGHKVGYDEGRGDYEQ